MLITAWWDVNRQFATNHNPRRRRMRPLKEMERAFETGVRISGFTRYDQLPPDQFQYTAYSWLEADCIKDAVVFTVKQLTRLGCKISFGLTRLNRAAASGGDDLDERTIGSFYWNTKLQTPLETIASGGVLLYMPEVRGKWRYNGWDTPRPTVRVPASSADRATYDIMIEIGLLGNPADVRSSHLPRYLAARNLQQFELVDADWRPARGHSNRLVLRRTLQDATEAEAICIALESATSFDFEIGFGADFKFIGTVAAPKPDGLLGISVTRAEP